jgi:hypothetical protein
MFCVFGRRPDAEVHICHARIQRNELDTELMVDRFADMLAFNGDRCSRLACHGRSYLQERWDWLLRSTAATVFLRVAKHLGPSHRCEFLF